MAVYKRNEFDAFIKSIESSQKCHWVDIARALNIDKNTITAWKNTPEARDAIKTGINHALSCMEQAGARDWRMWESKLKMLGLNPSQNVNAFLEDPRRSVLSKYGL